MSKEYRYSPRFQWAQYVSPAMFVLVIAIGRVEHLRVYRHIARGAADFDRELMTSCVILALAVVMGVVFWYVDHRLAGARITIEDDAVVYRNRLSETRIAFRDVSRLKFLSISYFIGWMSISSARGGIRLGTALEDIEGLLNELKASLDRRGLSDRYDEESFFRFVKTTVSAVQCSARARAIFGKLFGLIFVSIAVSIIAIVAGSNLIGWLALSPWPLIVYVWTEILFYRRVGKLSVRETFTFPQRDPAFEEAVYEKALTRGSAVYVVASLLIIAASAFF